VAFYTAPVVATPAHLNRAEKLRDRHRNPDGYRSAEADKAENAYLDQRDRAMRVEGTVADPTRLKLKDP